MTWDTQREGGSEQKQGRGHYSFSASMQWNYHKPSASKYIFISHRFCGSGTWEQLSWTLGLSSHAAAVKPSARPLSSGKGLTFMFIRVLAGLSPCEYESEGPSLVLAIAWMSHHGLLHQIQSNLPWPSLTEHNGAWEWASHTAAGLSLLESSTSLSYTHGKEIIRGVNTRKQGHFKDCPPPTLVKLDLYLLGKLVTPASFVW